MDTVENGNDKPASSAEVTAGDAGTGGDKVPGVSTRLPWWVYVALGTLSVAVYIFFLVRGQTVAYIDAVSRLELSRRFVDSPSPGFGQLGGVWLPVTHVLAAPLVWVNAFYFSGFAGSIVSMAAYVAAAVLVYKIVISLTTSQLAAFTALAVFALNPNMLYLQTTPMTEPMMMTCLAAMVYGVQRWIMDTTRYGYLIFGGVATAVGTLTRYECWVIAVVLIGIVGIVVVVRTDRRRIKQATGWMLFFALFALIGILAWLVWNQTIFGDMLYFEFGPYSKSSLWVNQASGTTFLIGHWPLAAATYLVGVMDNVHWIGVLLMAAGIGVAVWRHRGAKLFPILGILVLLPFFIVSLATGQRPMIVAGVSQSSFYNVRFGLVMLLPVAVFTGMLVTIPSNRLIRKVMTALLVVFPVLFAATSFWSPLSIVTLNEPLANLTTPWMVLTKDTSTFLQTHYDGGRILAMNNGNEWLLFDARITPTLNIYEGSNKGNLWHVSLKDPVQNQIRWIIMRTPGNGALDDEVWTALHNSPQLQTSYVQVYQNSRYLVYRSK